MCDYCGCRSVPLIDALGAEHARFSSAEGEIRALLAGGDLPAAAESFAVLAHELAHHTEVEEGSLFVELADAAPTTVADLLADHEAIDAAPRRLAAAADDAARVAIIEETLGLLHDHVHREEYDVFPAAVQLIGAAGWERVEAAADAIRSAAAHSHTHDHPHTGADHSHHH